MKITLRILLAGVLVCGCAHRQATSSHRAIDSIVAGRDVIWPDGTVLQVAERQGDSVVGIRIVRKAADGQERLITAESGTLEPGSVEMSNDPAVVRITLHHAQEENANRRMTADQMMLVFRR